jgi:hypothetical protein
MTRRRFPALRTFAATLLLLGACATTPAVPADAPTTAVLAAYGAVESFPGELGIDVVVIRDRHYVGGGITYVDEDLRRLQAEHRRLIGALVERGYRLLGAEWRKGPLPVDDVAEDHRAAVRETLAEGDDLDRRSIYQPIRYEVEFAGRLTVFGVEDPTLYDRDVAALEELTAVARAKRRHDTTKGPTDAQLDARFAEIRRGMRLRIDERGRASALNLLAETAARGERRAILLTGAAHVPAAVAALRDAGATIHVFTAAAFDRRTPPPALR